jgi:transcriptional regulator with XRE-family HTH domain
MPHDSRTTFASRLRNARERLGFSVSEIARRTGVSRVTQTAYEAGNSAPSVGYLEELAGLGADIHWLVTGESYAEYALQKFDMKLLVAIADAIERWANAREARPSDETKAKLLRLLYLHCADTGGFDAEYARELFELKDAA